MHSSASEVVGLDVAALRRRLLAEPRIALGHYPTPLEEMPRLRAALGGGPRLLVKRDDTIPFACGGNKVRKLELVAAAAMLGGADTLITTGGLQSNHARVTAAAAARLGMSCVLVLNGAEPHGPLTGNTRLMQLFGARIEYVPRREDRVPRMVEIATMLRAEGRQPFVVPLGASMPLGVLGFVLATEELLGQIEAPDAIIIATSSGGTQAGLSAGCALFGAPTRVIGVSADDPADDIARAVSELADAAGQLLGVTGVGLSARRPPEVEDRFVGDGYGKPTAASREAAHLAATTEGLILDPVYTAKAMAYLIASVRAQRFTADQTVVFWHTGGIPGLFA